MFKGPDMLVHEEGKKPLQKDNVLSPPPLQNLLLLIKSQPCLGFRAATSATVLHTS